MDSRFGCTASVPTSRVSRHRAFDRVPVQSLALDGALGGEDPLREVPGRVRLGRGEARLAGWRRVHRPPVVAELPDDSPTFDDPDGEEALCHV